MRFHVSTQHGKFQNKTKMWENLGAKMKFASNFKHTVFLTGLLFIHIVLTRENIPKGYYKLYGID